MPLLTQVKLVDVNALGYIGFGLIILAVLFFLGWAWEEPAGGLIAVGVGVLFFLSGSRIIGVVIGIIGIGLYMHAKDSNKKATQKRVANGHLERARELLAECWNAGTYEFDIVTWLDKGDLVLYDCDREPEIKKAVHAGFQEMGKSQVYYLNTLLRYLKTAEKAYAIREIKAMKNKPVRDRIDANLSFMFTYPDRVSGEESLYQMVAKYQQDFFEYIIWERETLTPSKLDDMIRRGEAIQKA